MTDEEHFAAIQQIEKLKLPAVEAFLCQTILNVQLLVSTLRDNTPFEEWDLEKIVRMAAKANKAGKVLDEVS